MTLKGRRNLKIALTVGALLVVTGAAFGIGILFGNIADDRNYQYKPYDGPKYQSSENYVSNYGYQYLGSKKQVYQEMYRDIYYQCIDYIEGKKDIDKYRSSDNTLTFAHFIDSKYYNSDVEEVKFVYTVFESDNPSFYFLNDMYTINSRYVGIATASEHQKYTDRVTIDNQLQPYFDEVDKLVNGLEDKSDLAISALSYDYVIAHLDYAYKEDGKTPEDAYWAHDITGLLRGKGVCETISKLFSYFLNKYGVKSLPVVGGYTSREGYLHIFNALSIDDKWYITDPTNGNIETTTLPYYRYRFFGLDKDEYISDFVPSTYYADIYNLADNGSYLTDGQYQYGVSQYSPLELWEIYSTDTTSEVMTISSELHGYPVTGISRTIGSLNHNVKTINVPSSIVHFPENMFATDLTSLTTINWGAKSLRVSERFIGYIYFGSNSRFETINFTDTVEYIPDYILRSNKTLRNIYISDNVITIGEFAFSSSDATTVVIGNGVKEIKKGAFASVSYKIKFYFHGTLEQWNAIDINTERYSPINNPNNIYFYSEEEPSGTGKYWHYVNNVPTIW